MYGKYPYSFKYVFRLNLHLKRKKFRINNFVILFQKKLGEVI